VFKSAIFFGFGLAVLYLLFGLIMQEASQAYNETLLENLNNRSNSEVLSALGKMLLLSLPIYLGMWVLWAMIEAALHRREQGGEDDGAFPWRFGGDEIRVMLCQLFVWVVFLVVFFVVYLALLILATSIVSIAGRSAAFFSVVVLVTSLAAILIASFFTIRFAPAAAMSVAQKRIGIGSAWAVAKGRFWPSFGAYTLLWVVGIFTYFLLAAMVSFVLYGYVFSEMLNAILSGDNAKTIDVTNKMYEGKYGHLKYSFMSGLLGIFWALIGLCIAGVASHLVSLYNKDMGISEVNVFD